MIGIARRAVLVALLAGAGQRRAAPGLPRAQRCASAAASSPSPRDVVRIGDLVDNAGPAGSVAGVPRARPRHHRHGPRRAHRWRRLRPPACRPSTRAALSRGGGHPRAAAAIHADDIKAALAKAIAAADGLGARQGSRRSPSTGSRRTIHVEDDGHRRAPGAAPRPSTRAPAASTPRSTFPAPRRRAGRRCASPAPPSRRSRRWCWRARWRAARRCAPSDLIIERRPRAELGSDGFVVAPTPAIGMAPRRPLPGRPAAARRRPGEAGSGDAQRRRHAGVRDAGRDARRPAARRTPRAARATTVSVTNLQSKRIIQGIVDRPRHGQRVVAPRSSPAPSGPTDPTVTGSIPRSRTEIIRPRPAAQPRS